MVDPRLRTIVAAFASGQCPQEQLADYLEDVLEDARAEAVRADRATYEFLSYATDRTSRSPWRGDDVVRSEGVRRAESMLRRRILARFPEAYPPFHAGASLADLPGIGVCAWHDGENSLGLIVSQPDEFGNFEFVAYAEGYPRNRIPCRIGYHVPHPIHFDVSTNEFDKWEWRYALAEPEPARAS